MDEYSSNIKYARIILVVIGVIIAVGIGLKIYGSISFRLISTDPKISAVSTVSPFFKASFNKPLQKTISVTTNPLDLMSSYSISGSAIIVQLNTPLTVSKQYSIEINNITDTKGQSLPNQNFSFKPQYMPSSELSSEQQQAILAIQKRYNEVVENNKLVQLLPFTSGGNEYRVSYAITYIRQQPELTIVITAPTQQGQNDALNWIREVGFNPESYTIKLVFGTVGG